LATEIRLILARFALCGVFWICTLPYCATSSVATSTTDTFL